MIFSPNTLINSRYIIDHFLDSGGMAEIYEAYDTYTKKAVALKVIKKERLDDFEDVERFQNEARYTAMFSHPNIIKIFNVGEYKKSFFISYELMEGKTIKQYLDERGHLDEIEALGILLQVLDATNHIHERGIIHNDIKPDNLFLFHDGNVKLLDFGIAKHIDDEKPDRINATVIYSSPEVLRSADFSIQSDIYSLGVILFELLTGKTPYMKKNTKEEIRAHLYENIPSISKYVSTSNNAGFDNIINKATNRNLELRYKSDKEFINDLLILKEGQKQKTSFLKKIFKKG